MMAAIAALWMFAGVGVALAEPGTYEMNDLGGAVILERGWDLAPGGWSDSSFKFQRSNKHTQLYVWHEAGQPAVDDRSAEQWGARHAERIDDQSGISGATVSRTAVETIGGRPTAVAEVSAKFEDDTPIVASVLSFVSGGKTIFIRAMGRDRFADEVRADARLIAETMTVKEGPLEADRSLSVADNFEATLPDGWRKPFETELSDAIKVAAQAGEYKPEKCFIGMRPSAAGEPDVMFACGTYMHVGPVDEYSFEGVEAEVHEKFFGSSSKPVDAATPVEVGDRTGFYFAPREGYRLALAPYDKGLMMTWGISPGGDEEAIDAAMKATLSSVTFTGPEGGAPIIGPDKWVSYYLSYRPTSAPVLGGGAVVLALIGGVGFLATRKKKNPYELDDDI